MSNVLIPALYSLHIGLYRVSIKIIFSTVVDISAVCVDFFTKVLHKFNTSFY